MNSFKEKCFKTYSSELGDRLFPGKDFFAMERRNFFAEINYKNRNIDSVESFMKFLDHFTPESIAGLDDDDWGKEKEIDRWENITKPIIRERVLQYFSSRINS